MSPLHTIFKIILGKKEICKHERVDVEMRQMHNTVQTQEISGPTGLTLFLCKNIRISIYLFFVCIMHSFFEEV